MAENTIRKHTAVAKLFFNAAVRKRIIQGNPFADLKATIQPNPSRFYFVTSDDIEKVLEACPDAEWRLIVSLSRYAGLRCPSEHLSLRWGDINWARGRVHLKSPKTEHHTGRESRVIPLFPELRPCLEEVFEFAEPGTEFVITRYRDTNANLRTQFLRIIKRAGLKPWPKLFQNLRSSRQTELEDVYPSHVVCAWMGNSRAVAVKHYLQVTDDHFERALQNPVQHPAVWPRTDSHTVEVTAANAGKCDAVRDLARYPVAEAGLEPARALLPRGF